MKQTIFLSLILLSTFFTGCSSIPNKDEMKKAVTGFKLPHTPKANMGVIYVLRPSALGGLVRFNVFLDDKKTESEMGWNRGAQYLYFYAKPGKHTVYSKAENWDSIDIDLKKNKATFIEQETNMGFIMARNSLKSMDEIAGKYYAKTLAKGESIKKTK